jgi:SAM-dependent methyltransferase
MTVHRREKGASVEQASLAQTYSIYYAERQGTEVYPVEFVVRALLGGSYERLKPLRIDYRGQRALDLGCGDGRNMPLLAHLGMEVYGVEIAADICAATMQRMSTLGVGADIRTGRNAAIPFDDAFFGLVLACHSCYYVDADTSFADNMREIARVTAPGGMFVFSAPMATSYIVQGARDLGDGHVQITNDPIGLRAGTVFRRFETEQEIVDALAPDFTEAVIGSCRNDFWGIAEHVWTVVCRRAG